MINNKEHERRQQHFLSFVEIFFAVVLGGSLLEFHAILFPPNIYNQSLWAILVVYVTAVTSWIGWHKSIAKYPYGGSRAEYIRSILDGFIVVIYTGLLFFGSNVDKSFSVSNGIDRSLCWYLWGFVTVFILYWIVGRLRQLGHGTEASKLYLIRRHSFFVVANAIVYTVLSVRFPGTLSNLPTLVWILMLIPFATIISFRLQHAGYGLSTKRESSNQVTIAVDLDGVIVEQVIPVLEKVNIERGLNIIKADITDWEYPIDDTNIKIEIEKAEQEEDFTKKMPIIDGAKEAMGILSNEFNIIIATSREFNTAGWSEEWLKSYDIKYTKLINTRSEGKVLREADILIDDYVGNIKTFLENGPSNRKAILFSQPWNSDVSLISGLISEGRVKIANSWSAILAILKCIAVGENKGWPERTPYLLREYLVAQSLSSFLASFLFLRGYILLNSPESRPIIKIPDWLALSVGIGFLVLAFFFAIVAFRTRLHGTGVSVSRRVGLGLGMASVGGVITGWIFGMEGLRGDSVIFQIFFWAGLIFFLIFSAHFLYYCWNSRRNRI